MRRVKSGAVSVPGVKGRVRTSAVEEALANRYGHWIAHLRQEFHRNRLCVVLGAGVSASLGFPSWEELLRKLSKHPEIAMKDPHILNMPLAEQAETLYRHYDRKRRRILVRKGLDERELARRIKGEWYSLVREVLYAGVKDAPASNLGRSNIYELLPVILDSPITLTYNFDDSLERMLDEYAETRLQGEARRRYEVLFEGLRPSRVSGAVYHVNGYLPRKVLDAVSEDLVFSEEQFATQFKELVSGGYSALRRQLESSTCLFIGTSFADENLRAVMRSLTWTDPGMFHFSVCWTGSGRYRNRDYRQAIDEYYFEVLHLNSMFLDDGELLALGRLLKPRDLPEVLRASATPVARRFYLVGVPGVGKTTVRRLVGGVETIPEWLDLPPEAMARHPDTLSDEETREVDEFVIDQVAKKDRLAAGHIEGIVLIDRSPIDAVIFPRKGQSYQAKARDYYASLRARHVRIQPGGVIFLDAQPKELAARLTKKRGVEHREEDVVYDLAKLKKSCRACIDLYKDPGWWYVDTTGRRIEEVVHDVSKIVYREPFRSVNLRGLLERASRGKT